MGTKYKKLTNYINKPEYKMNQTIKCLTIEQFGDAIAQCVKHGLTFEADVNYLEIKLTGGF